jgi:hypothetical protein
MNVHTAYTRSRDLSQSLMRLLALSTCIAMLTGCSSTTLIQPADSRDGLSYTEFNLEMQSSQVSVELNDQRSFIAREIHVARDSTRFLDVRTDASVTIPTPDINNITVRDEAAGRSRGMLLGAVAGGLISIGLITAFNLVGSQWADLWNYAFGGGMTVAGVLVGGLTGGAIGSAAGHTRKFEISRDTLQSK